MLYNEKYYGDINGTFGTLDHGALDPIRIQYIIRIQTHNIHLNWCKQ